MARTTRDKAGRNAGGVPSSNTNVTVGIGDEKPSTETTTVRQQEGKMVGKLDFTKAREGMKPAPEGLYDATFTKFKFGKSKAGNNKVSCTWVSTEKDSKGRNFWRDFTITEDALWALYTAAINMGAAEEDFDEIQLLESEQEQLAGLAELLQGLVGANCVLEVGVRNWEDPKDGVVKESNEVRKVHPEDYRSNMR